MFEIFKDNSECPVEEKRRQWIDSCFIWLLWAFRDVDLKNKRNLTPSPADFPVDFSVIEESAYDVLEIVAPQMDLDPDDIEIDLYQEADTEIRTGSALNSRIFLKQVDHESYSAGHYRGREEDGKYHIGLEIRTLKHPEKLIAVIAHELSHLKLLGEARLKKNNEPLTDLTTIVFGLGIFGANCAFQMGKSDFSWGYSKTGYLTQMDWGYALALNSYLREEKSPGWLKYLTKNVRYDYKRAAAFIEQNPGIVMKKRTDELETRA